ncbi:hypothetical protein PYW07_000231 [Mythimna separata]|uniref:Retrovirus-related Pol polyprotein from transposon TNT 1-94 n=1 Tax=Mythimna separata TaxID=271217 RepID=A0AAD8E1N3_MYTSE|nr:hypothetical protein PYW07_000231 [Mythimna separata]
MKTMSKQDHENMSSRAAVSSFALLPSLDEKSNFSTWKFRLKLMLEEKQVAYVLSEGEKEKQKLAEFIRDDSRVKSLIAQCVSDRYIAIIKDGKTAREMLTLLENTFERKSVYNRLYLKRKLITIKCSEPLEAYFIKFLSIVDDLQAIDVKIDDEDKICYLLSSLPKEYDPVITSIETMATEKSLTFDFVKARLLDAETKIITSKDTTEREEGAFITCFTCGKPGHKSYECKGKTHEREPHRGRGRGRAAGRGRRAACGHPGRGRGQRSQAQEMSLVGKADVGFLASEYMFGLTDSSNITFIVDSGCTQHIISDQYESYLTNIKELQERVKIYVANGQYIESNKKGMLKFVYKNIKINIEALIVKNISYNLLSVNKIAEAGFHIKFNKTKAVLRNKNIVVICYTEGRLYKLNAQLCTETCNVSNNKSDDALSNIWHRRLGHLNRKGLGIMNLPISEKVCSPCIEGKATRAPFKPTLKPRSRRVAELLHSDIAGPTKNCGLNGEKYFMTVIDDYSHFCVVYPLVHKSEATEKLINYIIKLENETGNKVKRIRCDNGGEYTANRLKNFCNDKGINIEYTLPYTPQQNGVAERLNRTLCDKTRTLFAETNVPKSLWCEAIQCAAYQLNRSPSWAINFNTPCFMKNGHNDLSRLRVFGSKAWATIIPKQDKLSKRARATRMVGYSTVGYRLWNPENNTIIVSRDVIFDESDFQYKESKEEQLIQEKIDYEAQKTTETRDKEIRSTEHEITEGQEIQEEEEIEESLNSERNIGQEKKSRSGRIVKRPAHLEDYTSNIVICLSAAVPNSFEDAVNNTEWKQAIQKELQALEKLDTWEEMELPTGKKAIDTKWIFKQKEEGTKKARLVVRGFQQKKEDIFDSNYAPVARHSTVRMFISKALQEDLKINQLDIPTAFLNGKLKSEVYIKVPQGLKMKNSNSKIVLKLKRALYGLTESPKCWNETIDVFAKNNGFQRSEYDYCMYYKNDCWMLIYVDDILIIGNGDNIIKELKQRFNAKNLGEMKRFLGMEIQRREDTIIVKQTNMIEKIIQKFNMSDCKGMKTPMEINYNLQISENEEVLDVPYRELIGSLIYLTVTSRPDLTFAVSYLSRYLDRPTEQLWKASKRVIRYLKETKDKGLVFRRTTDNNLYGFSDADWAGDRIDRKSVSGGIILHGVNAIAWFSKKQSCVALSTAESEYIAAAATAQELVNLKGLSQHLKYKNDAILLVDNIGAISMSKSYENSKRTKHIDIRAHFLKDIVEKGIIAIEYVNSNDNLADIMTKSLCKDKFLKFRDQFMC